MTTHIEAPIDSSSRAGTWHGMAVGAALIAPLLFLIGQALLPALPNDIDEAFAGMLEHQDQLISSRLLTAAGAFLFVPAAAAILRLVPRGHRGSRVMAAGVTLFCLGTFSNAISQVVAGYSTRAAMFPDVEHGSGMAVLKHLDQGLVALPIAFWSIPVFAIGALTMAIALIRSRLVPMWVPVLLIIGNFLAGALAGRGPIVAVTQAPVTVAFIALGVLAWHRRSSQTADETGATARR